MFAKALGAETIDVSGPTSDLSYVNKNSEVNSYTVCGHQFEENGHRSSRTAGRVCSA